MKSKEQEWFGQTEKPLFYQQRLWLVVAALWLHVMVIVFIVVQIKHRVRTPVAEWLDKLMQLLSTT